MSNTIIVLVLILLLAGCTTAPPISPEPSSGAERGARLFAQGREDTPPCSTCHQVGSRQVRFSLGPNLAGIATRAGTRIAGMTAEQYLHQSIVEPHRYVVSGYRDIMYPDYSSHLTEQDIRDLTAYLLTQ